MPAFAPLPRTLVAVTVVVCVACGDEAGADPTLTAPLPEAPPAAAPVVAALAVTPAKARVDAGAAIGLAVIAQAADGRTVAAAARWHSAMPDVATVDGGGVVRGVSPGYVRITAMAGSAADFAMVHVQRDGLYPDRVDLTPADTLLTACSGVSLRAVTVPDVQAAHFTWHSSDTTAVQVDAGGTVRGVGAGTAVVTARWTPDASRTAGRRFTVLPCPGGTP